MSTSSRTGPSCSRSPPSSIASIAPTRLYAARDFRMQAFAEALAGLSRSSDRVDYIQQLAERSERGAARRARPQERARRLRPLERGGTAMKYIDHHAHMVSRTTDDYQQMSLTGCVAVTEPAFWAGWDRSHADGFEDYFRQLTDFEPKRAAQYHIQHYAWMAMNPKEADDRELSREVLKRIPKFLDQPDGARHRRNRPQPRHPQRDRHLHRADRAGARAQAADPDPHAAPRGQAERHADLGRRPAQLPDARAGPRAGRSRRRAHARR